MAHYEGMNEWRLPGKEGYKINEPEAQAALMLSAYREKLREEGGHEEEVAHINMTDLEVNDLSIVAEAMRLWTEEKEGYPSRAQLFRQYADTHPNESVNTTDEGSLTKLLEDIRPTLH